MIYREAWVYLKVTYKSRDDAQPTRDWALTSSVTMAVKDDLDRNTWYLLLSLAGISPCSFPAALWLLSPPSSLPTVHPHCCSSC